jgi:hypothetical protein
MWGGAMGSVWHGESRRPATCDNMHSRRSVPGRTRLPDRSSLEIDDIEDTAGMRATCDRLEGMVSELVAAGTPAYRVFIGGFSQVCRSTRPSPAVHPPREGIPRGRARSRGSTLSARARLAVWHAIHPSLNPLSARHQLLSRKGTRPVDMSCTNFVPAPCARRVVVWLCGQPFAQRYGTCVGNMPARAAHTHEYMTHARVMRDAHSPTHTTHHTRSGTPWAASSHSAAS